MKRYLPFILVVVVAIATLGSGAILYRAKLPHLLTIPEDSVSGKGDAESIHIRGNPEASVTLEEFGDFECPSCAKLATFLDQVIKEYHPRVRLIFRNFPLPNHLFARDAALAAEAAGLQGRYWEMHDMLYREQPVWSSSKSTNDARTLFISYAETLELDLYRFKRDMNSDKARERIETDQAHAKSVGVKTAPSLFVDRREMGPNDRTPEGVRRLVDEAVKGKSSASEKK